MQGLFGSIIPFYHRSEHNISTMHIHLRRKFVIYVHCAMYKYLILYIIDISSFFFLLADEVCAPTDVQGCMFKGLFSYQTCFNVHAKNIGLHARKHKFS